MDKPHILLISLETLRRDHLGCYGARREVMPNLDRLADSGVLFRDSVANCGWTLPQHMTLMTGMYPLTHGALLWDNPPLPESKKLLAEHLKKQGYHTVAGLGRNSFGGGAKFGFDRGFDEYTQEEWYNQHMDWTENFVVEAFRKNHEAGPCFVYTHVNDSHEPFEPPEPWLGMWGDAYHNKYEGELSYVDYHLGRIFNALREMNIFDTMLTVIFADHGTEFWEHEFIEKKCNLYREILDVPLIFHCPDRLPTGRVVDGLTESAMVAPTLLDAAGLPRLPDAQGQSAYGRMMGRCSDAPDYVCAHTVHSHQKDHGPAQFDHYAIQTLDFKFIRAELHAEPDDLHSDWKQRFQAISLRAGHNPADLKAGAVIRELYDLRVDPGEHRTLIAPNPVRQGVPKYHRLASVEEAQAVAKDLEAKLDSWIEQTTGAGNA